MLQGHSLEVVVQVPEWPRGTRHVHDKVMRMQKKSSARSFTPLSDRIRISAEKLVTGFLTSFQPHRVT